MDKVPHQWSRLRPYFTKKVGLYANEANVFDFDGYLNRSHAFFSPRKGVGNGARTVQDQLDRRGPGLSP
jgi:hypothetical protein